MTVRNGFERLADYLWAESDWLVTTPRYQQWLADISFGSLIAAFIGISAKIGALWALAILGFVLFSVVWTVAWALVPARSDWNWWWNR